MNDELQYHKRSDSIKWILTLIAFILIGIVLIGIICGWFDRKPKEAEEQVPEGSTPGMVVSDAMKSEGISLAMTPIPIENYADYGISPIAVESAVTVTATVEPATTTYPALYWGVHFLDADSVWASGKNVEDYVSVSVDDANTMQATLTCKQAFGEQVILEAQVQVDSSISASCTVDYVARPTVRLGQTRNVMHERKFFTTMQVSFNTSTYYSVDVTYGAGTVQGSFSFDELTLTLSDSAKTTIEREYMTDMPASYSIHGNIAVQDGWTSMENYFTLSDPASTFLTVFGDSRGSSAKFLRGMIATVGSSSFGDGTATTHYTYTYGEKQYAEGDIRCDVDYLTAGLEVEATNVKLSMTSYVF